MGEIKGIVRKLSPGCMISSAVWIGADSEPALSVSSGRLSPIETDKAGSLSDTLHTSAYHTAGTSFPDNPRSYSHESAMVNQYSPFASDNI